MCVGKSLFLFVDVHVCCLALISTCWPIFGGLIAENVAKQHMAGQTVHMCLALKLVSIVWHQRGILASTTSCATCSSMAVFCACHESHEFALEG